MSSPQYLLDAVMAQRDSAMNSLAQTVAQLRDKDDELAKKDEIIERLKAAMPGNLAASREPLANPEE